MKAVDVHPCSFSGGREAVVDEQVGPVDETGVVAEQGRERRGPPPGSQSRPWSVSRSPSETSTPCLPRASISRRPWSVAMNPGRPRSSGSRGRGTPPQAPGRTCGQRLCWCSRAPPSGCRPRQRSRRCRRCRRPPPAFRSTAWVTRNMPRTLIAITRPIPRPRSPGTAPRGCRRD